MPNNTYNRRKRLWEEQDGRCYFCDVEMPYPTKNDKQDVTMATIEHLVPKSDPKWFGKVRPQVCACKECNNNRRTMPPALFKTVRNSNPNWKKAVIAYINLNDPEVCNNYIRKVIKPYRTAVYI